MMAIAPCRRFEQPAGALALPRALVADERRLREAAQDQRHARDRVEVERRRASASRAMTPRWLARGNGRESPAALSAYSRERDHDGETPRRGRLSSGDVVAASQGASQGLPNGNARPHGHACHLLGFFLDSSQKNTGPNGATTRSSRVDYGSVSTFSTAFSRHVGEPPSRYAATVSTVRRT
jgi:AraC-like DNA-binding protein